MDPQTRIATAHRGARATRTLLLALLAIGGLLAGCITGENDTLQDAGPQEDGPRHDPIREQEPTETPLEQDGDQERSTEGGGSSGIY